jgi:hypothetical protein
MHTYVSAPDPPQPPPSMQVLTTAPEPHRYVSAPDPPQPPPSMQVLTTAPEPHRYVSAPDPHQPQTHTFVVSVTPRMLLPAGGASPRSPNAQYDAPAQYDASAQNGRAASPPPSNYVDRVLQLPPGTTAAFQMQQQQGRRDEQIRMREVGAVTGAPPLTFIAASYRRAEAERRDGLLERRDGLLERRDERAAAGGSPARHPTGARDDAHAHANGSPAPAAALHRQSSVRASRPLSRRASAAARSGRSGGARP